MAIKAVSLEKGMYQVAGKTFTQVLEEHDPSGEYKDANGELDAFQRQLKRLGIRVKGPKSDIMEKFFQTTESAILFPEFVSRTVREGMVEDNILPSIIATTTQIDSDTYKSIYMDTKADDARLKRVSEGGNLPVATIRTKENDVKIFKYGRLLETTYEAIKRKRADVFSVFLRQIGSQIVRDKLLDAIDVIANGDGNDNAADIFTIGTAPLTGTQGTMSYRQFVEFWAQFKPWKMNTILAPTDALIDILTLEPFMNPNAGFKFQNDGELISPLGAKMHHVDGMAAGSIIGLDKRYTLEEVVENGVTTEFDKLIDRQLERTAISSSGGFAKLFQPAAKVLEI